MFDMISQISKAESGDHVTTKYITRSDGNIIAPSCLLYFIKLNADTQDVSVALDPELIEEVRISLRSIQQIFKPNGSLVYRADPRDMVYGKQSSK